MFLMVPWKQRYVVYALKGEVSVCVFKNLTQEIRLESQLQKHTFHMTTGLLVGQIHFLHFFTVIKNISYQGVQPTPSQR